MDLTTEQKEKNFERIVPLMEKDNLTYEKIKSNPILRPLAEKNSSYLTSEKNVIRALKELEITQIGIKEIVDSNPDIYESTAIIAKVERYKLFAAQVIHALTLQKDELKEVIFEMLKINEIEYGFKNEEFEKDFRQNIEEPKKEKVQPKIEIPKITYFDNQGIAVEEKSVEITKEEEFIE